MGNTILSTGVSSERSSPIAGVLLWCTLLAASAVASGLLGLGSYEQNWSVAAHMTARAGLFVFGILFLWKWLPDGFKAAASPRALGLGFAIVHFTHLTCLLILIETTPREYQPEVVAFGAPAFVVLAAMTITSIVNGPNPLSTRQAKFFNLGVWYLWLVFTLTYVSLFKSGVATEKGIIGLTVCLALLAARLVAGRSRKVDGAKS